jgi:hypothetical protein
MSDQNGRQTGGHRDNREKQKHSEVEHRKGDQSIKTLWIEMNGIQAIVLAFNSPPILAHIHLGRGPRRTTLRLRMGP